MLNLLLSTDLYLEVGESMGFDFSTGKDRLDVGVQERLAKASYGRAARISQIRSAWLMFSYGYPLTEYTLLLGISHKPRYEKPSVSCIDNKHSWWYFHSQVFYLGNVEQPMKGHFVCTGVDFLFLTTTASILIYFVEMVLNPKQCYPDWSSPLFTQVGSE